MPGHEEDRLGDEGALDDRADLDADRVTIGMSAFFRRGAR
jgi:hypothetical protein